MKVAIALLQTLPLFVDLSGDAATSREIKSFTRTYKYTANLNIMDNEWSRPCYCTLTEVG